MTPAPRRSWLWLQGLACGALACLATPTALLLAALLAPGLIMWTLDKEIRKPNARAMLLCGIAFSFPSLQELWSQSSTVAASFDMLRQPGTLPWAWAGACAGWLLREGVWMTSKLASEAMRHQRVTVLKAERAALEAEWGSISSAPGLPTTNRALSP